MKWRKRKELWVSLFIAFIMIFSAFGVIFYGYTESPTNLKYGDYDFKLSNEGFYLDLEGKKYTFEHFPGDLDKINISESAIAQLKAVKMVYLTYNPNQSAVQEIAAVQYRMQNDLNAFGIYGALAFTAPTQYKVPVMTCSNATRFVPVIEFRESNMTRITEKQDCLILEASYPDDFSRMKDRILFGMLGIIKNG